MSQKKTKVKILEFSSINIFQRNANYKNMTFLISKVRILPNYKVILKG